MINIVILNNTQQLIADVYEVHNSETDKIVGYLIKNPYLLVYNTDESIKLYPYCLASINTEFEVLKESVLTFGEVHPTLLEKYNELVNPTLEFEAEEPPTDNEECE